MNNKKEYVKRVKVYTTTIDDEMSYIKKAIDSVERHIDNVNEEIENLVCDIEDMEAKNV